MARWVSLAFPNLLCAASPALAGDRSPDEPFQLHGSYDRSANSDGYTDLSGTAAYNQRLSVRRAQSVQAELVRDGVAPAEIGIEGHGEGNPLVPTARGVREPQNRRVEIVLR